MLIGFPPEESQTLPIELSNHTTCLCLMAKVAHVRQLEAGDFFVGLRFDKPLGKHEMEHFVKLKEPKLGTCR
ncbi:hypothetical protein [Gemmata algarum]|nr:hypothetical protein [Gemmata algarum]